MSNASTSSERRLLIVCSEAMVKSGFNGARRREWFIWAAIHRACPTCKQGPGMRCLNMLKLKNGEHIGVRWPHDDRVDWPKMYDGLKKRGYIE